MKKILSILIFIFLLSYSFGQVKTPYEKKVDQIMIEMYNVIGVDNSLIQMAIKLNDWDYVKNSKDFSIKSKMMDKNELIAVVLITDAKLKEAKKLKNEIDFKRDADRIEKIEKEKKLREAEQQKQQQKIEEEKQQELLKLEVLKNENLKRLEKENQEKEKKAYYDNSDYVKIINKISNEFSFWLKKGEFEKTENYNERIENRLIIFDSICHNNIINQLKYHKSIKIDLETYNADKECFPINIYYNKLTFKDTLHINVSDAEKFKLNINHYGVKLPSAEKDWCIIDNYFHPLNIHIENVNSKPLIILPINYDTYKPLSISTKELNITNYLFEELLYESDKYEIRRVNYLNEKRNKEFDKLIKSAEDFEKTENFQDAKINYIKALKLKPKTEEINQKIKELDIKIVDIKRKDLLVEAESFRKKGLLTKSKNKYLEANKIQFTNDISDSIKRIDEIISLSNKKSNELFENYEYAKSVNELEKKLNIYNKLEEIKGGYGIKFYLCIDSINNRINSEKSLFLSKNINYENEIWSKENELLLKKLISYNDESKKFKQFEYNLSKAIISEDKKYLKILKEENIHTIIDFIANNKIIE
jgi:hypothetical protein